MDATASSILPDLGTLSLDASPPAPMEKTRSTGTAESDQTLMERYRDGDAAAFNELYRRYRAPVRRFVAKLCWGQDQADEIVQEVWLAVIRGARSYRPTARFTTYLFSIAHRRLQDHWRSSSRHSRTLDPVEPVSDLDDIADDGALVPEDWAAHAQLRSALMAAIDQLPPQQRAVFLLKAEAELSLEEIAAATGASIEATKSRMRYAVTRLRARLSRWGSQETRSI
ncbi:MAG TPA: sigma-70 family RNA polymerase sigma factor [Steroidobacteraceae bacterium]|nr:sigma-70 family RNA polymerase sigma factor [Steroidobacteraceae bacterium]